MTVVTKVRDEICSPAMPFRPLDGPRLCSDNQRMRGRFSFRLRYSGCMAAVLASLILVGCAGVSSNSQQSSGNGTGAGQLAVSPATMGFGNVAVGHNKSLGGNLTATTADIAVSSAAWNGQGYSVSGITFPVTVPAGQSVPFTVTFTPQASGNSGGSITFDSNAANSTTTENLTGTGTQSGGGHTVALSWNPSTSQVAGYNVYRGAKSGGPYSKINSALDGNTAYTDGAVQSGQTYYYVTTAVDSVGTESSYSNEAPAVIP